MRDFRILDRKPREAAIFLLKIVGAAIGIAIVAFALLVWWSADQEGFKSKIISMIVWPALAVGAWCFVWILAQQLIVDPILKRLSEQDRLLRILDNRTQAIALAIRRMEDNDAWHS